MSDQQLYAGGANDPTEAPPAALPHNLGKQTRKIVSDVQQKAGEQVRSGIDSGKKRAAGALQGVAESLMNGSASQHEGAGQYIRQAGEQVRRAADYLEHADVRTLTRDTESFARRQPAAFIGGAFVLGAIAARLLKSAQRTEHAEPEFMDGDTRDVDPLPVIARSREAGASREADRGGRYEHELPMNSYREPMPPTFGGQS